MLNYRAKRVLISATFAMTGVTALTMNTSHVGGTVVIPEAFWGARGRNSVIAGKTMAHGSAPADVTTGHGSTGRWVTGTYLPFVYQAIRSRYKKYIFLNLQIYTNLNLII